MTLASNFRKSFLIFQIPAVVVLVAAAVPAVGMYII